MEDERIRKDTEWFILKQRDDKKITCLLTYISGHVAKEIEYLAYDILDVLINIGVNINYIRFEGCSFQKGGYIIGSRRENKIILHKIPYSDIDMMISKTSKIGYIWDEKSYNVKINSMCEYIAECFNRVEI